MVFYGAHALLQSSAFNRNSSLGERYSPGYIRCKHIRCEAPEVMHSFSPRPFRVLWPPKTGSGIKYLLMTFSLDDSKQFTLVVAESWQHLISDCQNITGCVIQ